MDAKQLAMKLARRPASDVIKFARWLFQQSAKHWQEKVAEAQKAGDDAAYNEAFDNWHTSQMAENALKDLRYWNVAKMRAGTAPVGMVADE